ncbi:Clp protease [Cellulomonas humilata]|uniref:Clp protease n=1 Tax=Cellulomonas humilata TaxID=144055 RepID=A0A7Y6A4B9_9CELL|nr:Clp protease N-terminal domain-containing protein [Cellulomonas humilata]NUU18199.1 Clp protease [Cellulomonas humilata]
MFEKFAKDAREAVVRAQDEGRALGADRIGTEHVLLGMVRTPDTVAARALERLGLHHAEVLATVRTLPAHAIDADALAGVGIDLDAVRAQVEASFGPGALDTPPPTRGSTGHLPFEPASKKLLEIALREAVRCKHRRIDTGHLLLAVARLDDTTAYRVLSSLGVGPAAVRESVTAVWADVPVG